MIAWVMSGGGARGAYEAGVIRYLCTRLEPQLGISVMPQILCGTSIGAITSAWVGALGSEGIEQLSWFWQRMEPGHVYKLGALDLARAPIKMLQSGAPLGQKRSLLDPSPLYELIRSVLPWDGLRRRLETGALRTLVVAATDVSTGRCVHFADGWVPRRKRTATTIMHPTQIDFRHVLASAAIPFIFPVVKVDDGWYVDGALRQNTPLSPAIELGASRVLVIGCSTPANPEKVPPITSEPTPAFLAGKALAAMLTDPVEEDIRRLESFNKILEWGKSAYPDFEQRISSELRPYRTVKTVHLRPTENIASMAGNCFRNSVDTLPWPTRQLLSAVHTQEGEDEADLMSTLLFHHSYTQALEDLGYQDAHRQEEALARMVIEGQE